MEAVPGNPAIRCRKCEGWLSAPRNADQNKYALVPTKYGAFVRTCKECGQLWLGYMLLLPKDEWKIILKMIDKEL